MDVAQIVRDIAASVIVLVGLFVMALEIVVYIKHPADYSWIYLIKAFSAAACSVTYIASLLRLYPNGSSIITPLVGRPVFIFLLLSLALGGVINVRTKKGAK